MDNGLKRAKQCFLAELVVPPSTLYKKYIDRLGRYPPAPFTEKIRQTVFDTFSK